MNVNWSYEGLRYRHTEEETDDPECHEWQEVSPSELIVHAANLHLFRNLKATPAGLPLWSLRRRPAREDLVRTAK